MSLLNDSIFIKAPAELTSRNVDAVVFGNLPSRAAILQKAIEVAKQKQSLYPVVIFCKSFTECQQL
jgi:hypothetical protein